MHTNTYTPTHTHIRISGRRHDVRAAGAEDGHGPLARELRPEVPDLAGMGNIYIYIYIYI